MGFQIKKSRLKQLIKEEYQKVQEGEYDAQSDAGDFNVDALLTKMVQVKKEATKKYLEQQAAMRNALDIIYDATYQMKKTELEQKGHPNAETLARQFAEKEREQNIIDANETFEKEEQGAI